MGRTRGWGQNDGEHVGGFNQVLGIQQKMNEKLFPSSTVPVVYQDNTQTHRVIDR